MSGLTGQNLGPRRGPTPIQPDLEEEKKLDDAVAQYLDGCTFMYDMMTGKYPYMMDMDGKDVVFESNGVGHSALEAFKVVSDFDAKHVNVGHFFNSVSFYYLFRSLFITLSRTAALFRMRRKIWPV